MFLRVTRKDDLVSPETLAQLQYTRSRSRGNNFHRFRLFCGACVFPVTEFDDATRSAALTTSLQCLKMARTHAVSIEERRAARAAEKKYGSKLRRKHKRKQAKPTKVTAGEKKPRKPTRWKWRTVAKREIRREIRNSSKKPAIPRAAIERLIREFAPGFQFEQAAMAQLRSAAEAHVVSALEAARFVADAENVPTLDARHMHVVAAVTNKMTTATPMPDEYREGLARPSVRVHAVAAAGLAEPTVTIAEDGASAMSADEDGSVGGEGDDDSVA